MNGSADSTHPLVSVVVPVFNGAEFIEEALSSVERRHISHWDCTVVDNVSTDGTAEASRIHPGDPRFRLVSATTHVGIYANHNRALAAASPELLRQSAPCRRLDGARCSITWSPSPRATPAGRRGRRLAALWRERDLDSLPTDHEVFDGREIVRKSLTGGPYVTGSPSSLLLRTSLFDGGGPSTTSRSGIPTRRRSTPHCFTQISATCTRS